MKIVAIIQARMGSSRLPGKVLRPLGDRSVLAHVIARTQACPLIDEVVVATTTEAHDQAIVDEALACGASGFRGSESNVLERYYQAAKQAKADVVVRITSDCPLLDPSLLTRMLEQFKQLEAAGSRVDYYSNTQTRSFPRGLDAEIMTFAALERAYREASKPYEQEHVTPYLYQHPESFTVEQWVGGEDHSALRWTLDTPEDYRLIEAIYQELYRPGEIFTTERVLALMAERPDLPQLNAHIQQKGLEEDANV